MSERSPGAETPSIEERARGSGSWLGRGLWVAASALMVGAFFVPQEIPLEWYPLNEPGTDINYLEIKCASDADGDVQIFYNATTGLNELDSIKFPISPTEQTYTYTFPLVDAPLVGLRLDPVEKGGTLTVDAFRIINRRGELIRRFTREMLVPMNDVAAIDTIREGWKVTSTPGGLDPVVGLDFDGVPIVPVGMNHRNLLRCLLSTGYLSGMLTILMLAVVTAFWKPVSWGDFARKVGLIAALSVPLAMIGNRGLIRNSIAYARFEDPTRVGPAVELDVSADRTITGQLFWDVGNGLREEASARRTIYLGSGQKTLRFPLPQEPFRTLRLDPHDAACTIHVTGIRMMNGENVVATLPLDSLQPVNEIATFDQQASELVIEVAAGAKDPALHFTEAALAKINQGMATTP
jgi:hypothetical protein